LTRHLAKTELHSSCVHCGYGSRLND
jgi:hypothetical protein